MVPRPDSVGSRQVVVFNVGSSRQIVVFNVGSPCHSVEPTLHAFTS